MRMRIWTGVVVLATGLVAAGLSTTGCEAFEPKPEREPPPAPSGRETAAVSSPTAPDVSDISGHWDLHLKAEGVEYVYAPMGETADGITMTLAQTDDEVTGHWTGGRVEGDVEEDGSVELILRLVFEKGSFVLSGRIGEEGYELAGDWESFKTHPQPEGTWWADRY